MHATGHKDRAHASCHASAQTWLIMELCDMGTLAMALDRGLLSELRPPEVAKGSGATHALRRPHAAVRVAPIIGSQQPRWDTYTAAAPSWEA